MINIDFDHFAARIIQDCLTEATAGYWLHRAYQFQQAAPRPGEFHGNAPVEELRERWRECMSTSLACRRHAQLIMNSRPQEISLDVLAALAEVA
jgi:hypothetical protein